MFLRGYGVNIIITITTGHVTLNTQCYFTNIFQWFKLLFFNDSNWHFSMIQTSIFRTNLHANIMQILCKYYALLCIIMQVLFKYYTNCMHISFKIQIIQLRSKSNFYWMHQFVTYYNHLNHFIFNFNYSLYVSFRWTKLFSHLLKSDPNVFRFNFCDQSIVRQSARFLLEF